MEINEKIPSTLQAFQGTIKVCISLPGTRRITMKCTSMKLAAMNVNQVRNVPILVCLTLLGQLTKLSANLQGENASHLAKGAGS